MLPSSWIRTKNTQVNHIPSKSLSGCDAHCVEVWLLTPKIEMVHLQPPLFDPDLLLLFRLLPIVLGLCVSLDRNQEMASFIQIIDQSGKPIYQRVTHFHSRGGLKMTNSHAAKKSFEQPSVITGEAELYFFHSVTAFFHWEAWMWKRLFSFNNLLCWKCSIQCCSRPVLQDLGDSSGYNIGNYIFIRA